MWHTLRIRKSIWWKILPEKSNLFFDDAPITIMLTNTLENNNITIVLTNTLEKPFWKPWQCLTPGRLALSTSFRTRVNNRAFLLWSVFPIPVHTSTIVFAHVLSPWKHCKRRQSGFSRENAWSLFDHAGRVLNKWFVQKRRIDCHLF